MTKKLFLLWFVPSGSFTFGTDEGCFISSFHPSVSALFTLVNFFISEHFFRGIGFYLTLIKAEKLIEQKEYDLTKLNSEEKEIFLFIKENKDKGVYQSNIVEKFNIPKSKVSRILDKL